MSKSWIIMPLLAICLLQSDETFGQLVNVTITTANGTELIIQVEERDATLLIAALLTSNSDIDVDECSQPIFNNCTENETCVNLPSDKRFFCDACLYRGTVCNMPSEVCNDTTLSCDCAENYIKDFEGNCSEKTPCFPNPCPMPSICNVGNEAFNCTCPDEGYDNLAGVFNETINCTDIDECVLHTHDCHSDAQCNNIDGSYICVCKSGYTGDGTDCSDVDECGLKTFSCPATAHCVNTNGSYECKCNQGFEENGTDCSDIDECSNSTACISGQTCLNSVGSFRCIDSATVTTPSEVDNTSDSLGSSGSEGPMPDVDMCTLGIDDCHENAKCIDTDASFACECNDGYMGDGKFCEDINECDEDAKCENDCINFKGSYICSLVTAGLVVETSEKLLESQLEVFGGELYQYLRIAEVKIGVVTYSNTSNLAVITIYVDGPASYQNYFVIRLVQAKGISSRKKRSSRSYLKRRSVGGTQIGGYTIQNVIFPGPVYFTGTVDTSDDAIECENIEAHIKSSNSKVNVTCSVDEFDGVSLTFTVKVEGDNFAGFDLSDTLANYSTSTGKSITHVGCADTFCGTNADCTLANGRPVCNCQRDFHDNDVSDFGTDCVLPVSEVNCGEGDNVEVKLFADYFYNIGLDPSSLHLLDPSCKGSIEREFLVFAASTDKCGAKVIHNDSHVIYSNDVTNKRYGVFTNDITIQFSITCTYPKEFSTSDVDDPPASVGGLTTTEIIQNAQGTGSIVVGLGLFQDPSFSDILTSNVSVRVGQSIYVMVNHSSTTMPNFLKLDECWLTPTRNHADTTRLLIIEDSCATDDTIVPNLQSGIGEKATFELLVVQFPNFTEFFLHCDVSLCAEECQKNCSSGSTGRRRRQAQDNENILSVGPVVQEKSTEGDIGEIEEDPTLNSFNFGLGGLIGVLCAVVALAVVVAFIIYRKKGGDLPSMPKFSSMTTHKNSEYAEQTNDNTEYPTRITRRKDSEFSDW